MTQDAQEVRKHYAELAETYDQKANRACRRAYETLMARSFGGCRNVIEVGAGATPHLGTLDADRKLACDLSLPMLQARPSTPGEHRVVSDAQALPFADGVFDGAYCINVLEHVPSPQALVDEAARVLAPGGRFLAVTPNGGLEWLLDALERLHLKLPEGPHAFLDYDALRGLRPATFREIEHRCFLIFPAGPPVFVAGIDRLWPGRGGAGLFQYALWERAEG